VSESISNLIFPLHTPYTGRPSQPTAPPLHHTAGSPPRSPREGYAARSISSLIAQRRASFSDKSNVDPTSTHRRQKRCETSRPYQASVPVP